jgi:hypothetical protein
MDTEKQEAPPAPPGMTMIHNVRLEEFEKAVYMREHEKAGGLLLSALRRLKTGGTFVGYTNDSRVQATLYTRFCAAVISLLADPQFTLSQDGFDLLASEHAVTDLLFRASAFETSDHLLAQISSGNGDGTSMKVSDGAAVLKFLLTYSLRSSFALNFDETFRRSPQAIFALYAGMISPLLTIAVQAQERREALLGMHSIFADVKPGDGVLSTLSDAYMYTSYGLRRDKHDAKATMHAMLARMLHERGVPIPTAKDLAERRENTIATGDKPTMLVCLEWFTSNHAMYRCYAPIIRQLRSRFRLVAMCIAASIDEQGKSEFDEWHEVNPVTLVLADLIGQINRIAPDVVYYPSVGMALWWVALASVRLAPVQVMTLGHPASSRSPAMDYVLCDEGAIGDPALFTEKIVEYPNGSARFIMRPDAVFPEPLAEDHPEVVRIAVPAMLCKLNATFMSTLRDIAAKAEAQSKKVEFHFFINMLGINLHQSAREIRDWVPESKIYERMHYTQYLEHLKTCHLHLCTFPFGGTNSNIDSMVLGVPLIALLGDEPHERFDAMMIRRARLPESLVAKTREEYADEAVRLITDDTARNALRDHLRTFDLQGEFFGDPPPEHRTAFVDAMVRCYEGDA